jgi:hypothetical protein
MRGRLIPLLVCVILVGILATVALAQVGSPSPARAAAVRATGSFEISNSGDGRPIFATKEIGPGGAAKGRVTIEDSGSVPVVLTLKREELDDVTGAGGAALSTQLQLVVLDVSEAGSPVTIYSGPLATMPEQRAGEMQPGGSRTYEFVATLPNAASSSQNALQSTSTSVAYSWIAAEGTGEGEDEPPVKRPAGESAPGVGVPGVEATFDLTVPRIVRRLVGGGLVSFIDCDASCRIMISGKVRASAHGHHRTTKIRFGLKRPYTPGSKKMRIPIARGMRIWLRQMPPPERLRAKLTFTAIGIAGGRDVVKKTVRLRVPRHHR